MATSHESLPARAQSSGSLTRLPPVRLPSREELTAAARVAPLLRVARDLAAWAGSDQAVGAGGELSEAGAAAAVAALDLSAEEVRAAWAVATGTGMLAVSGHHAGPGQRIDVLTSGSPDEALDMWCAALQAILAQESLDGLATALYTAGRPVRLDALFEAYAAAVGALTGGADDDTSGQPEPAAGAAPQEAVPAFAPGLEPGLELLADLGVVELGEDEDEDEAGLTVTLSPIGMWAVRDRLQARGWRVPVLGGSADGGAAAVLAVLADYDAEDGEAEIAAWLGRRRPERAAEELTEAASRGSPGLRGAAFAVMDRVGAAAVPAVRRALASPVLRPHAAVWLREHGEEVSLSREDSAWLLVDLGARPAGGGRARGRGGRTAARPAAARPGGAGGRAVAGGSPGRDRTAHHAEQSPSGTGRGQGGAQGRLQGPIPAVSAAGAGDDAPSRLQARRAPQSGR